MKMIADLGCTYIICGHSERRQGHVESNEFVAEQVVAALKHGLHPIVCVGETEEERRAGREKEVVKEQLDAILSQLSTANCQLSLAYEPVWAIGTGKTATPADAQAMHSFIRTLLTANRLPLAAPRILYGGSMKPENAEELLKQPDIDGALIGGASLDPGKFKAIVDTASKLAQR
jgi:triosephosphate isomerase